MVAKLQNFMLSAHSPKNIAVNDDEKSCCKTALGNIVWFQINIDCGTRENITKNISQPTLTSFDSAQKLIYSLMARDCYPRFLKSDIYQGLLRRTDSRWLFLKLTASQTEAREIFSPTLICCSTLSFQRGWRAHAIQSRSLNVAEIAFPNLCDSVDSYSSSEFVACIILYLFNYVQVKKIKIKKGFKGLKEMCT